MDLTDAQLIERCRGGDAQAWNEFVDRFGRLVYSIPRRLGLSSSDADDIFQRVFTIAWRELDQLREQSRIGAWLATTTHRESWRLRRVLRTRPERTGELAGDAPATEIPTADQVGAWERQNWVHVALAQLEERCRTLIHALFFESPEPSYQELAERIGVPIGSLGPTRARCLVKLEQLLELSGVSHDLS